MTTTIVNTTVPAVTQEIEKILETYPHHPYQQAFAIPDLRKELIADVLSHVSNHYVVAEEAGQRSPQAMTASFDSDTDLQQVDEAVHQGIERIFHRNAEQIQHQIPEPVDPRLAASNWFG